MFFLDDSSVQWQRFFVLTGGQGANVLFPGTVVCFYRGHTLGHLGLYLCGRLLLRVVLLLVVLLLFLQLGGTCMGVVGGGGAPFSRFCVDVLHVCCR